MILCFSGTGNTLKVASQLASHLGDKVIQLSGETLLSPPLIDCHGQERVVWAFPVYSWGVPPVVVRFIERVTLNGGSLLPHFMVTTCGDDAGLTHRHWRKLLWRRGWDGVSSHTVIMPNTYTLMKGFDVDPVEVASAKLSAAPSAVESIASSILHGEMVDNVVKGRFAWIKTRIIYPWFVRYAMSPRPFRSIEACTSCGLCARHCPTLNIVMVDGKPRWDDNCAMCLRCYHSCPAHAIAYGNATRGKGRYLCPRQ